ncbi:bacterial regulatory helix-turn-helix, lysR family protein [Paraburkholderia xenovorans LB400]|jgi:DNA-binding transcriptional LysR family regulator|uniref:Transcriptional regulator, LysR family n=1 Tax=Paraburkholderia xenovorans (strain LB400) TaxID=266265 RepID=Q140G9_PARXL|nr:LysR family transcriptional regulator [Paraburkholderia xenovorans]ABE30270.1 transcriptional regulator, LysR family [Paraburkholderia xenovorans LB400]AIP30343.1 bacterial regulatory helix-turn-helix, lysR family protein [Paraburkholderia xenovorans LB400]
MDRIDAMRLLVRIVERGSFAAAARDLDVPRSSVTQGIQELERRLGAQLLQRTTRQVRPTLDGEAFYRRCLGIIADVEEAEAAFNGAKPSGLVRVDVHGTLARYFMMPALPSFLDTYPDIQVQISEADRLVDLTRDGVDCVLRVGELPDSSLVGRRIAMLKQGTFASPEYLARHGVPQHPAQLEGHRMVGYLSQITGEIIPLEFLVAGKRQSMTLPASVMVTGAETNISAARLGLGLVQVPRYRVADDLSAGTLAEVLGKFPPRPLPVHVLYTRTPQLSPRVRVFVDWLAKEFAARLSD